jgi:hypothetical protein
MTSMTYSIQVVLHTNDSAQSLFRPRYLEWRLILTKMLNLPGVTNI